MPVGAQGVRPPGQSVLAVHRKTRHPPIATGPLDPCTVRPVPYLQMLGHGHDSTGAQSVPQRPKTQGLQSAKRCALVRHCVRRTRREDRSTPLHLARIKRQPSRNSAPCMSIVHVSPTCDSGIPSGSWFHSARPVLHHPKLVPHPHRSTSRSPKPRKHDAQSALQFTPLIKSHISYVDCPNARASGHSSAGRASLRSSAQCRQCAKAQAVQGTRLHVCLEHKSPPATQPDKRRLSPLIAILPM